MSGLPKPELRGHLKRYIVKTMVGAFAFATMNCSLYYFLYMEPKKRAYAEYARTYNREEHMKILKKYGYLQSAQPE